MYEKLLTLLSLFSTRTKQETGHWQQVILNIGIGIHYNQPDQQKSLSDCSDYAALALTMIVNWCHMSHNLNSSGIRYSQWRDSSGDGSGGINGRNLHSLLF